MQKDSNLVCKVVINYFRGGSNLDKFHVRTKFKTEGFRTPVLKGTRLKHYPLGYQGLKNADILMKNVGRAVEGDITCFYGWRRACKIGYEHKNKHSWQIPRK